MSEEGLCNLIRSDALVQLNDMQRERAENQYYKYVQDTRGKGNVSAIRTDKADERYSSLDLRLSEISLSQIFQDAIAGKKPIDLSFGNIGHARRGLGSPGSYFFDQLL